ncbi:Transposase IS4 [Popillia japonica]|uniref:Transposase IS4 n=1 Tax=Popillia japonica TaxID=7064 RepID=A0AAW1HU07_POPJA
MNYEKEQASLFRLFEEVTSGEEYDDEEIGAEDNIEEWPDNSDSEQQFNEDKAEESDIELKNNNYSRSRDLRPTNIDEINALILLYLAGVRKAKYLNTEDLWKTDGTGIETFRLIMSLRRFRALLRFIWFDDISTRQERVTQDKLAPVRDLFDHFNENLKKCYSHSDYVTIDEKLEAFRGKRGFRQYIPSKPNKYGVKIFAISDAKMFYISHLEVYVEQSTS